MIVRAGLSESPPNQPEVGLRPGWPEIAVGLVVYLLLVIPILLWLIRTPDEQAALRGVVGMAANGIAGACAASAAIALRIRDFRAFGFRAAEAKWLLAGAALGVVAVGLSFLIEHVYFRFVTEANTQGDFQAAARAGAPALFALVLSGALLTPFGEEVLFRGVVANALNRYGAWAGVVGSAAIFGVAHGPSVILVDAFMVGVLTGVLFRRTNSIWPGLALHAVYNGIWLVIYSFP